MFKLTVVGGPSRGTIYQMKAGENVVGRVAGNDIVLASTQVSKKHCALVVNNEEISVQDLGSSNGTFVNGVLTKLKKLLPGDRISIGDYVFEVTKIEQKQPAVVIPMPGNTNVGFAMPAAGMPTAGLPSAGLPTGTQSIGLGGMTGVGAAAPTQAVNVPPKDLKEKVQFYFEKYVINFVFNLNEKHEWKSMLIGMLAILAAGGSILSVYPVIDRVTEKLDQEAGYRTSMFARLIADQNAPFIYEKLENKLNIGSIEKELGVLGAYIVDMEGRIMAPARDINQYLTEPTRASFSAVARGQFSKADRSTRYERRYGNIVAVAEPVRVFSAGAGKNVTTALALVFFDRDTVLFDVGTIALAYIQAMILAAILAVVIFFSLYRLTLRPLSVLNEDIDLVLKGSAQNVSKKFKMSELDSLIDIINSALRRIPNEGGTSGGGAMGGGDTTLSDDVLNTMKFLADRMVGAGLLIFSTDKKILHLNPFMEEITGIRNDAGKGQDISAVARDAAFISFADDVLTRAVSSFEPIVENFEFSGTEYKMECLAVGPSGSAKAFLLSASKGS